MDVAWENVTGATYQRALDLMKSTRELLEQRERKGFPNQEEALAFADSVHCMLRAYSPSNHCYYYVNHTGELISKSTWYDKYQQILYYVWESEDGKVKKIPVGPERFCDTEDARGISEVFDGLRQPLYHRDYFTPKGAYDEARGTFNVARPFRYFAKETNADTSHIYTLLQHIAGVNFVHLLAWLREKMVNPTKKTEVVPVFVSKEQGTGKSTFAEVLCAAMFEEENVIVSHQYDGSARFNADYADALIVCLEEKKQDDNRNSASAMKSSVTATKIRKEQKGIDPIYQESYTDYIMTTNGEVPIKFDSARQRRFMVMEVDDTFTRESSALADEVFTKLYGYNGNGEKIGPGLKGDPRTIQQFKWELLNNKEAADTSPRDFVKTDAYNRCFQMPRTNEAIEIEALIWALAPFIRDSLIKNTKVDTIIMDGEDGQMTYSLHDVTSSPEGFVFYHPRHPEPARVAINRMVVFTDQFTQKPFAHSTVERCLLDARKRLRDEFGLALLGKIEPPSGGFKLVSSRMKMSPTAWFVQAREVTSTTAPVTIPVGIVNENGVERAVSLESRLGVRVRYSGKTYQQDPDGELETLNELKPGAKNRGKDAAQYLDTFLLESDDTSGSVKLAEKKLLQTGIPEVQALDLYIGRLTVQEAEAERLFKEGIICRAVYSGAKSIHMLVRVSPAPTRIEERRWLFAYLCKTLSKKLTFDAQVGDPTRLTRAPITRERITYSNNVKIVGTQKLLLEDWTHVYNLDWKSMYQAWCNQPRDSYERKGSAMLPTKELYRDAARAFMEGTFFTDNRWNGKRQECFFPAYRIVRALGYTEEQVWAEVTDQVRGYYKPEERAYWISRHESDIIKEIERDLP